MRPRVRASDWTRPSAGTIAECCEPGCRPAPATDTPSKERGTRRWTGLTAIASPSHRQASRTAQWIGETHATMEALLFRREFELAPAVDASQHPVFDHIPVHVRDRADSGPALTSASRSERRGPKITFWSCSTTPTGSSNECLLLHPPSAGFSLSRSSDVRRPFSSERKLMSTLQADAAREGGSP
jgi:hypothetical protein